VNPVRRGDAPLRIVLSHVYSWPEVRRGGERYLHELGAALVSAGHKVTILSTGTQAGRSTVHGVPVVRFPRRHLAGRVFKANADEVAFGFQAGAWVASRGVDVWHALGTADAAVATLMGPVKGLRSVHTSLGLPNRKYWDEDRPDRRLHDLVVARVDSYICLSQASADGLQKGWGRRAEVLSGGVDLDRFTPAPRRHDRPALLYSGILTDRRKNLHLLLEAAAILRTAYPELELWLSGPGDPTDLIAASPTAAQKAVVNLGLGEEEDQAQRYGRAWATVLPSVGEAFGLCLLESMACGTPIVALSTGGGPAELVRPGAGVTSGATPEELADACATALELARVPDTVEACRSVAVQYDWRRSVVPRLEAIYDG
jgi:glycosyltransferase involved in cell wall biosynthesis